MGGAKCQYTAYLEFVVERAYEEAQSRLRLSMICKDMVRPLTYDLHVRILELAQFVSALA